MLFPTLYSELRPIRLSEATRRFAYDSLNHVYGLDTKKTPCVFLDHIQNFKELSALEQYDAAIYEIAAKAPLRIVPGELLSGAATLGDAISHFVPARYEEKNFCYSVSHVTLGFDFAVAEGMDAVEARIRRNMAKSNTRVFESMLRGIDAMRLWHKRYIEELQNMPDNKSLKALKEVPFAPPKNFHQAVQSLWFLFAFTRLCGNWSGIGRIDQILGPYLKEDLAKGTLTLDQAREILAHFFIKGCEWICGGNYGSGDAQHYQNIVLAGVDEEGNDGTNEVTYLVLDIIEELGIGDFPLAVRLNTHTPQRLLKRCAEVLRHGGGILAFYNEDTVLQALTSSGYPLQMARRFANDGCWEVQIPGDTCFTYIPFDGLFILQHETLRDYITAPDFSTFEDLYGAYIRDLKAAVERLVASYGGKVCRHSADSIAALFEKGCIESGRAYADLGPKYNVLSPHIGGAADVINSLYAIKKAVHEEKRLTLPELCRILAQNWEGNEPLRLHMLNRYSYFGNGSEEADALACRLLHDFAVICKSLSSAGLQTPPGISTFGRQIEWAPQRAATPFGKKKGSLLSGNFSPTPGTDGKGATAVIRSFCAPDLTEISGGCALDLKLMPACVKGEEGIAAVCGLLQGFLSLGGFFLQLDVQDAGILKAAQKHPEDYQTLSVRVSGWNARFVTLDEQWQRMIIERTAEGSI